MFLVTLIIVILTILCYVKILKPHSYWKEQGVRYVRPWPFFGYMAFNMLRIKAFSHVIQDVYNAFPEQRCFGAYQFLLPLLIIRDPDLIKRIMVKEFDIFPEHREIVNSESDPLWTKNLFAMRGGEPWRDMRSTLSPMFTSSKMKSMFVLMKECAKNLTDHFIKQGEVVSVEMKDTTARFANDVIASTAFGITCNSFENPNNEFYFMTKELARFSLSRMLKFFAYSMWPSVAKLFKFRLFGENVKTFYGNVIRETIKIREENKIIRPDMIHLLLEARKGCLKEDDHVEDSGFAVVHETEIIHSTKRKKTEITDDDILSQALLFFFAGFETVSIAMSHLSYELALNREIQKKLKKEVNKTLEECGGDVSYEALQKMKFLDMVVSETLRKWPPATVNDRHSIRPFTIEPVRVWEKPLLLETGTVCVFPVYAIHRDHKNYPDPDKFDPERFSDENKHNIKPFTYLPFGAGPRNCIGSRFALLEIKTFIFYILSEFEIVPVEKTRNPIVLSKKQFHPIPDGGFWVGLKPRHKKMA